MIYLFGADQEILDWPVKISFLRKIETEVRLSIKPWFSDMGLAQVTLFWACNFLFNNVLV